MPSVRSLAVALTVAHTANKSTLINDDKTRKGMRGKQPWYSFPHGDKGRRLVSCQTRLQTLFQVRLESHYEAAQRQQPTGDSDNFE